MKKFVTRAIIIALIGSTGILSGCYGPFPSDHKNYISGTVMFF